MSSEAAVLGVTLNRERLNEVAAPESFAADGEFAVALRNEGEPVHVHLRFDGPLAGVAAVAPPNHYVDEGSTRTVRVSVAPVADAVTGTLDIIVGHGAEKTTVQLRIEPPEPEEEDSTVREDGDLGGDGSIGSDGSRESPLAKPAAEDGSREPSPVRRRVDEWLERARGAASAAKGDEGSPLDTGTIAVVALAGAALVGAGVVAVTLDGLAVTLGVVAVCIAVLVAGFLLVE
ncbi:hypothetical protein ACFQFH_09820 [Halobaculum halobium]|uniref:MSP domain-containing protein n=1 Tax=Halobaculum halobium TaxID=3032281 RepID=A0ABD5TAU6_9EURY|nr:hypothetical protein [Halobaculum sp. SYNS20]